MSNYTMEFMVTFRRNKIDQKVENKSRKETDTDDISENGQIGRKDSVENERGERER
jgi:hypothetical protein